MESTLTLLGGVTPKMGYSFLQVRCAVLHGRVFPRS
jgi:hypothetical protein